MVTRLAALRAANNLSDVALLLGVSPKGLAYTIRIQPVENRYTTFTIPKKSGGERTIHAPEAGLKLVQSRLADLLQDCVADINVERQITEQISHGFRRSRSIITNAQQHCNKRHVLNVDLQDFFPTINLGRVRGFFIKNRHFLLPEPAANAIAQIACHMNELPQGAPSSPVISNLIAHILDIKLAMLARSTGCHYTRYADDLTFSTNLKNFPSKMCRFDDSGNRWVAGSSLRKKVEEGGFLLNESKTRIQFDQSRQDVTGIIVNNGINVRVEYYKDARAKCHELFRTGKYHFNTKKVLDDGTIENVKEVGSLNRLDGIMSFIDLVKRERRREIIARQSETNEKPPRGFLLLYRKYLYYRKFYADVAPVILCEGKTDNIYLKYSAYSMYEKFPFLAAKVKNTLSLNMKLFNYSDTTLRTVGLGGGTGQLNNFISNYKKNMAGFVAVGERHPVIIVIDNDAGSKKIYSTINNVNKLEIKGDEPFYYICENLYVVPTPKTASGDDTMIETFLPKKWLDHKLNGKSFNPDNTGLDVLKQYGKSIMAEHVVKKNHKDVDFSDFAPLLENVSAAIADYYKMIAP